MEVKKRKRKSVREAVLNQAAIQFGLFGFDRTTLEGVGKAVGVGRSAVLYHFPDKKQLYAEVFEHAITPLFEEAQTTLLGPESIMVRISRMIGNLLNFFSEKPFVAYILTRELTGMFSDPAASKTKELRGFFDLVYTAAKKSGELHPTITRDTFVSALFGPILYYYSIPLAVTSPNSGDIQAHAQSNADLQELLSRILSELVAA